MIQSLRRTKWLTLLKFPEYMPRQFCSVSSSERLSYLSPLVSAQENIRKSSFVGRLQSSKKPKLVLKYLKDCGFSESQIGSIVSRRSFILFLDPEKTLKPKVDFLFSKGISKSDLVRIVSEEPKVLTRSLEKHLMPLFDFLKSVVGNEEDAARAVRNYPYVFRSNIRSSLELNMKKLLNTGVPQSRIAMLIVRRLRVIALQPSKFEEALTMVKEMGFEPTEPTFLNAVASIGWCSKPAWKEKMDHFRSYGLSDSEILAGFKKQPLIMMFRPENRKAKMSFFLKAMHWCPHKVIMRPHILMLSLEERTIPRLSVLYVLVSQGKVEEREIFSVLYFLKMTEKKFVEKFVTVHQDKIPRILDAHQGKLKIEDLHTLNTTAVFSRNEYWSGT